MPSNALTISLKEIGLTPNTWSGWRLCCRRPQPVAVVRFPRAASSRVTRSNPRPGRRVLHEGGGIVDQPRTVRSFGVLYTSMAVAEKISGQAPHINRLNIGQRRGGIVRRIRRLGAGGGTDMFPGMRSGVCGFAAGRRRQAHGRVNMKDALASITL